MLIFVHELKLMIEYFFDLEDEVSTVMSHKFLELFHQINNIGKGQPLTFNNLLVIQGNKVLQLFICIVFSIFEGKLQRLFLNIIRFLQICQGVGEFWLSDIPTLFLLGEDYYHYLGNLDLASDVPGDFLGIKALQVKIVYILSRVCLEKFTFVQQRKRQTFETLVETLGKFLAHRGIVSTPQVPLEHIPRVIDLIIFHFVAVAPHSSLDEVHTHILLLLVFDRKPNLFNSVQLIYKLKERTLLEDIIAELIFNMSKHLEEFSVLDLRVTQNVSESVCQCSFYLQQRFKCHLIYLLETISVKIRKIFDFKLSNQFFVCFRQKQLSQGAIGIDFKYLIIQLLLNEYVNETIVNDALISQALDNGCFLLPFRSFNVEQGSHLIGVQLDRLLVVERTSGQIEVRFMDHGLDFSEFGLQEFFEEFIEADDVRIPGFGVDDDMMENIIDLALEILLIEFFYLSKRHFVASLGLPLIDFGMDGTAFEIFLLQAFSNFQLVNWNLVIFDYLGHNQFLGSSQLFTTCHLIELGVFSIPLELLEDYTVQFVLVYFSLKDRIRIDILLSCNQHVDLYDLVCLLLIFFLFNLFLLRLLLPIHKDLVDSKEHLPKDTLDEGSNDINDDYMHKAEEKHDVGVVLGIFPAVIKGYHRPSCLSQDLHHYIL